MRKKRLLYNTLAAIIQETIALVCGFILPRQMLLYYGSEVNGLVSSITQFLGFVTLLEMGVGAVVQSALYGPLSEKDDSKISAIVKASNQYFRKIAGALFIYTVVLMVFYPLCIDDSLGYISTALLVLSIAISTIGQYFFGITNQLLLNADQKSYVQLLSQALVTILNTTIAVLLIRMDVSIVFVKLVGSAVFLIRPMIMSVYVKKNYAIDSHIKLNSDPLPQRMNAMAQHIATYIVDKTDIVVLTLLSSLTNVSIYYVYHLVTNGLYRAFLVGTTGIQSLFGDMYAKKETGKLKNTYEFFEWAVHVCIVFVFSCAGVLILPFVTVYTNGINDANYIQPIFGTVIVIAFGIYCLRCYYNLLVKAVGHFKQTQTGAFIEAALNLSISVILVWKLGLIGVAIGTLAAVAYRMIYYIQYIHNNIINTSYFDVLKLVFVDVATCVLICLFTGAFHMASVSYISWGLLAIKVVIVAGFIVVCMNALLYKDNCVHLLGMVGYRRAKQ